MRAIAFIQSRDALPSAATVAFAPAPAAPAAEGKPAEADSKHIEKGIAGLR